DGLFGLEYAQPDGKKLFRFFALEAERTNRVYCSNLHQTSWLKKNIGISRYYRTGNLSVPPRAAEPHGDGGNTYRGPHRSYEETINGNYSGSGQHTIPFPVNSRPPLSGAITFARVA